MRQQTIDQLTKAVNAIRLHFQSDIVKTKDFMDFSAQRPDIYIPAAFMQICRGDARGTVDTGKFDTFMQNFNDSPAQEMTEIIHVAQSYETDEEIEERINTRFLVIEMMTQAAIEGNCRSMVIGGAAGVGKTMTVTNIVKRLPEERCSTLKGKVTATGLFRTLWKHRFDNHVIVMDDSDSIFDNETSLNFLKAACDSSDERFITWASNANQVDEDGEDIPTTFEFRGAMIFITNKDFKEEIAKDNKLAPHFSAMISRSHYIDIGIKTERDYMIRIKSVVYKHGMLNTFEDRVRDEIIQFIDMNRSNLIELSLRIVKKIADLTLIAPNDWRKIASVTCFK